MSTRRFDHSIVNHEKDYIKKEALDIEVGGSRNVYCPFCDNAKPYAPAMSLTRTNDGLLYHCYRAGCGESGYLGSIPSEWLRKETSSEFIPRPFMSPTRALTCDELADLSAMYNLTVEEVERNSIKWISGRQGISMPLMNRSGSIFGYNTKYWDNDKYKAQVYKHVEEVNLHWPDASDMDLRGSGTLIVVEDIISSIRVSRFAQGVALLGTDFSDDKACEISKYKPSLLIVALDPDATDKAVKIRNKYMLYYKKMNVVCLSDDPKDLSDKELERELNLWMT